MSDGEHRHPDGDIPSTIGNVAATPFDVLLHSDESVLGTSVRRILQEIDTQGENYAAHSSSM